MKKSFKVALAVVCLIAVGAFFMGCSNASVETGAGGSGSGSGGSSYTPKYAVGDIVLNDGTKVAYSVAKDYAGDDLTNLQSKAIAVIFRADTESKPALGVGIKNTTSKIAWCKDKNVKGYDTIVTEMVCDPDGELWDLTFINSPNTDGSKNLSKMIAELTKTGAENNDTGVICNADGTVNFASSDQTKLASNYPAFEFAYYYGKNSGHNITSGSDFENGWYLPSLSELSDIYQAGITDNVIENALDVTGGNKFDQENFWSSSQCGLYGDPDVYYLWFYNGNGCVPWSKCENDGLNFVCAVRAFN